MSQWLLKIAIRYAIKFLLNKLRLDDVLRFVRNAESFSNNDMAKRASVYNKVKADVGSTLTANLVTELAVYLQKRAGT